MDSSERESKLSGKSKSTITAAEFLRFTGHKFFVSQTLESAELATSRLLTSSAEDSPARTSRTQESEQELTESAADCGENTQESFASYDPASSSWRTSQLCLTGEWSEYSETWPRAGMTRNGRAYELPTLAHSTGESESGLWPTPDANTSTYSNHYNGFLNLREAVKMWPTPRASAAMANGKAGRPDADCRLEDVVQIGGQLNPTWVEWLMGYPKDYTEV